MLANPDTFYLTIPSDGYGNIFTDNHPGKFKAKLAKQILLPGKQWEVALTGISFPSTSLSSSTVYDDINYDQLISKDFMCAIELDLDAKNSSGDKIGSTSCWLRGPMMKNEYQRKSSIRLASRDGVNFCNRMFARLNYKLHSTLPDGLSEYFTENVFKNGRAIHFKWPEFEWENAGGAYRLKINNEGVVNGDYKWLMGNAFLIHLDIAKAFNLVIPKKDGEGNQLTSLVSAEHFREPLSHVSLVNGVQRLWEIVDGGGSFQPEGTATSS